MLGLLKSLRCRYGFGLQVNQERRVAYFGIAGESKTEIRVRFALEANRESRIFGVSWRVKKGGKGSVCA